MSNFTPKQNRFICFFFKNLWQIFSWQIWALICSQLWNWLKQKKKQFVIQRAVNLHVLQIKLFKTKKVHLVKLLFLGKDYNVNKLNIWTTFKWNGGKKFLKQKKDNNFFISWLLFVNCFSLKAYLAQVFIEI